MSRIIQVKRGKGWPEMKVSAWRPYMQGVDTDDKEGSAELTYYGFHMAVRVFTYTGPHAEPFTTLAAYFFGEEYHCRLPRYYHPRWLGRLANAFDWAVFNDAKKAGKL